MVELHRALAVRAQRRSGLRPDVRHTRDTGVVAGEEVRAALVLVPPVERIDGGAAVVIDRQEPAWLARATPSRKARLDHRDDATRRRDGEEARVRAQAYARDWRAAKADDVRRQHGNERWRGAVRAPLKDVNAACTRAAQRRRIARVAGGGVEGARATGERRRQRGESRPGQADGAQIGTSSARDERTRRTRMPGSGAMRAGTSAARAAASQALLRGSAISFARSETTRRVTTFFSST